MPTQQEVDNYIEGALSFPVKDERQLLSMVLLHFSDLDGGAAENMVAESIKFINPVFWNPNNYGYR